MLSFKEDKMLTCVKMLSSNNLHNKCLGWIRSYCHQIQIIILSLGIVHWSPPGYNQEQKQRGVKWDIWQQRMSVHLKNFRVLFYMMWCGWSNSFDVVLFLFNQSWGFFSFLSFFFFIFPPLRGRRLSYALTMLCRTDMILCASIPFPEAFLVHPYFQYNLKVRFL